MNSSGGQLADRALVLMFATFILLTPPIIGIFDIPTLLFGIPLLHVYCYATWLTMIACGGWLSMRMNTGQAETGEDAGPDRG